MSNFKLKTREFDTIEVLTRDQMKKVLGGNLFQCGCEDGSRSWGCISVEGCISAGESVCPGNYSCSTVQS